MSPKYLTMELLSQRKPINIFYCTKVRWGYVALIGREKFIGKIFKNLKKGRMNVLNSHEMPET